MALLRDSLRWFFRFEGFWTLGEWVLWAIARISGITVSVMTAWAGSTWDLFWDTFHWAGFAFIFILTLILFSISATKFTSSVQAWRSRHDFENTGSTGGRGGEAGNITGKNIRVQTGRGGSSGPYSAGRGGDGGSVGDIRGDGVHIILGDGGNAGQWDGRGGQPPPSPGEIAGMPTQFWQYGRGGAGGNSDEYNRRMGILTSIRIEYVNNFPDKKPFIDAGIDQVPTNWVNKRLKELNEPWCVEMQRGGYKMPPLLPENE